MHMFRAATAQVKPSTSGLLPNLRKLFLLKLAASTVRAVNRERDGERLTYGRKEMIQCGFAQGINALWEIRQLFPHFQEIIREYRVHFDGENPDEEG